ncbi:MAG: DUF3316 domain-containing protein [Alistipes sp.]|nr:DUF3316 domain-containing protein [Alistipes sp.]
MRKLISLLLLMVAGAATCFAQEESTTETSNRHPVTVRAQVLLGGAQYVSHYLNEQQYAGGMRGLEFTFGRMYPKSKHLSWELKMAYWGNSQQSFPLVGTGMHNAANTSSIQMAHTYDADYAVYYNWFIKDRLQIRLGGYLNVNAGILVGDGSFVNNSAVVQLQTLLYASAQIRYGWDFKKWGLDLYANAAMPLIGGRAADGRFTSFADTMLGGSFNSSPYKNFVFAAPHNTLGADWEIGIDFAMPRVSLSMAYGGNGLYWHDYGIQNKRDNAFFKLGVSVNLVCMKRGQTTNRHF